MYLNIEKTKHPILEKIKKTQKTRITGYTERYNQIVRHEHIGPDNQP